jgi:ABC-type glutathione transport system ATPase component
MHPESSPSIAIFLINVKKHCQDRDVEALGEIDLEVAQGKFISLIGPSGSGKSTASGTSGRLAMTAGPPNRRFLSKKDSVFLRCSLCESWWLRMTSRLPLSLSRV